MKVHCLFNFFPTNSAVIGWLAVLFPLRIGFTLIVALFIVFIGASFMPSADTSLNTVLLALFSQRRLSRGKDSLSFAFNLSRTPLGNHQIK